MLLILYGLYLFWWYRTMRNPPTDLPQIMGEAKRLVYYAKLVGIAFCIMLLLSTGCESCIAGLTAIEERGFNAIAQVWQGFIAVLFWIVIII